MIAITNYFWGKTKEAPPKDSSSIQKKISNCWDKASEYFTLNALYRGAKVAAFTSVIVFSFDLFTPEVQLASAQCLQIPSPDYGSIIREGEVSYGTSNGKIFIRTQNFDSIEEVLSLTSYRKESSAKKSLLSKESLETLLKYLSPRQLINIAMQSKRAFENPRTSHVGSPEDRSILRRLFEHTQNQIKSLFTQCGQTEVCQTSNWGQNCDRACNCDGTIGYAQTKKTLCAPAFEAHRAIQFAYTQEGFDPKLQCGDTTFTEEEIQSNLFKNEMPVSPQKSTQFFNSLSTLELRNALYRLKGMVSQVTTNSMERSLRSLHEIGYTLFYERFKGKFQICESSPCKDGKLLYHSERQETDFCNGEKGMVFKLEFSDEEVDPQCMTQFGSFLALPPPNLATTTPSSSPSLPSTPSLNITSSHTSIPTWSQSFSALPSKSGSRSQKATQTPSQQGSRTPTLTGTKSYDEDANCKAFENHWDQHKQDVETFISRDTCEKGEMDRFSFSRFKLNPQNQECLTPLLRYLTNVTFVDFNFNSLIKKAQGSLLESMNLIPPNLEVIYLYGCDLDDQSAITLAKVIKNQNKIGQIDLRHNQISDIGMLAIAESLKNKTILTHAYLSNNPFNSTTTTELQKMRATTPKLQYTDF